MRYLSVSETAEKWNISERSVRNYCAQGRVLGAFLTGKTWNIPEDATKPERRNRRGEQPKTLPDILKDEKKNKYSGGIYHKTQIELTYNSNHIEGSRLTREQTRYIFETNTIGLEN
ncbi:MAG TPA: helix-turn-helix domain-containing protein, partial [Candidatus Anaerobutyricum stercoripullorum]|nr:helix-turn-helix domain-containing protein [Candidatus Anaerobutyricum stercoripullorum]